MVDSGYSAIVVGNRPRDRSRSCCYGSHTRELSSVVANSDANGGKVGGLTHLGELQKSMDPPDPVAALLIPQSSITASH